MYGKIQESGIIEVIPFICISAIQGQHPGCFWFFTFSELPQSSSAIAGDGVGVASAGSQALFSLLRVLIHIWRPQVTDDCYIFVY